MCVLAPVSARDTFLALVEEMKKKVAIIVGGTSGIGAATAKLFVERGWTVVVGGRRIEKGMQLVEQLGENARFHQVDAAEESQVKSLIEATVAEFGQIDCLFNNAGIPGEQVRVADIDLDDCDRLLRTHLRGVILGMKHVAPVMCSQRCGSIVNTGSIAGRQSGFSSHIYSAAKAAVIHLTRCVAAELGEYGVRVNSVSPGAILTGIFAKGASVSDDVADRTADALAQQFALAQPIRRPGIVDDVAAAVLFLAEEGTFITGHDLTVDGGMTVGRTFAEQAASGAEMRKTLRRAVVSAIRAGKSDE